MASLALRIGSKTRCAKASKAAIWRRSSSVAVPASMRARIARI
jgi:hypothetical protein